MTCIARKVGLVEFADFHACGMHFVQKRIIDLGAAYPLEQYMHLDA